MPNKNKIFHDIFSGKDGGEMEITENTNDKKYVQKGGLVEFFIREGTRSGKYYPKEFQKIKYYNVIDLEIVMLYCLKVVLALYSRGITIEDRERSDVEGNDIVYITQGFSWTVDEIKKGIGIYCYLEDNEIQNIFEYIMYLYKEYTR